MFSANNSSDSGSQRPAKIEPNEEHFESSADDKGINRKECNGRGISGTDSTNVTPAPDELSGKLKDEQQEHSNDVSDSNTSGTLNGWETPPQVQKLNISINDD